MTKDEFLPVLSCSQVYEALRDGKYIACKTKQQTQAVTNMLLDLGFKHGKSGYSRRYAEGDIQDELDTSNAFRHSWYSNPCVNSDNRIEYHARISNKDIQYDEFVAYYTETMGKEDDVRCDTEQLFAMI